MSITINNPTMWEDKESLQKLAHFCTNAGITISNLSKVESSLLPEEERQKRHMAARAELLSKIRGGLFAGCFEDDEEETPTIKQLEWYDSLDTECNAYGALTPTNDCVLNYTVRTSDDGRIDAFFEDTGELVYAGSDAIEVAQQACQAHFEGIIRGCFVGGVL